MTMQQHEFTVANMNCDGCVANIRRALEEASIAEFDIELSKKLVSVTADLEAEAVAAIIQEAGYEARPASEKKQGFPGKLFST